MPRSTILFKASAVSVHRQSEEQDGTLGTNPVVLVTGKHSVLLEADAAELLVNYLQVIRAYFNPFPHSRKIIAGLLEQVGQILAHNADKSGNQVISNNHVSDLIQQLGCLDDWRHRYPHNLE